MKQQILKKYLIILSGLAILFILALVHFYIHKYIYYRSEQLISDSALLSTYQQNEKIFTKQAQQVTTIKNRIALLEQSVVTPTMVPSLITAWKTFAVTAGVQQIQITPSTNNIEQLHIEAQGSMESLTQFLSVIQSQSYQVRMLTTTFSADPVVGWKVKAITSFTYPKQSN